MTKDSFGVKNNRGVKSFILIVVILTFVTIYGVFLNYQYHELIRVEQKRANVKKEIEAQIEISKQLEVKRVMYNSDEFIENIVRASLGLYRPNEIIFKRN